MTKRIAISGASGLIGTMLSDELGRQGYSISRIARSTEKSAVDPNVINWDIDGGTIDRERLEGHDVVINLAGANIADKRWTPSYKKTIRDSRIKGTRLLSETISKLKQPPQLYLSASAVGFYGCQDNERIIDENGQTGKDFLSTVCREWEDATKIARESGIRVVCMRLGAVITQKGGALGKMLPIFKMGAGGVLGSGKQYMSWIALTEIPKIILYIINNERIAGPVNFVSPQAVTNKEFTKTLGKMIKRPTIIPVPSFGAKLLFGEMADALLIGGAHVVPQRLRDAGYHFQYPDLSSALKAELN